MKNNSLQGCSVVVTRPAGQAQALVKLIEQQGGQVILFPVLKITATADQSELDALIQNLTQYSILLFISPNAVNFGLSYLLQHTQIPDSCKIATVGMGSAKIASALLQRDIDIVPAAFDGASGGYNSESLLALAELNDVNNKKIAILRGNGGRDLLAATLRERGATVSYICTYTRTIPDDEQLTSRLTQLQLQFDSHVLSPDTQDTKPLCVTITSGESLTNFIRLLGSQAEHYLAETQLIVINERLVAIAKELGFKKNPLIANNASDQSLVDCVQSWYSSI